MERKNSEDIASEPSTARGDDANGITNLTQICVQLIGGDTAIAIYKGGYAGLGRLCQIEDTVLELGGMHVRPNYRRLGIARKIVQILLESKITGSTVYCLPFAHLQGFYESEGFKEVSKEDFVKVPKEILEKHCWCNETYPHKVLLLKLT